MARKTTTDSKKSSDGEDEMKATKVTADGYCEHRVRTGEGMFRTAAMILIVVAVGGFLYKMHKEGFKESNCIEVTAKAERIIKGDNPVWTLAIERPSRDYVPTSEILEKDKDAVRKYLFDEGITFRDDETIPGIYSHDGLNKISWLIMAKDINPEEIQTKLTRLLDQGAKISVVKSDKYQYMSFDKSTSGLEEEAAHKALQKAEDLAKSLGLRFKKIHKIQAHKCKYNTKVKDTHNILPYPEIKASIRVDLSATIK